MINRDHRSACTRLMLTLVGAFVIGLMWMSQRRAPGDDQRSTTITPRLSSPKLPPVAIPAPRGARTREAAQSPTSATPPTLDSELHTKAALIDPNDSEVSGVVVDVAGGPVPFALVSARSLSDASLRAVLTNEDGEFHASVRAGRHDFMARAEAFSTALRQVQAPAAGVILELGPSSAIVGRIVNADTLEPLSSVTVRAAPAREQAVENDLAREPAQESISDESGRFSFSGLRGGGRYSVLAASPEWQSDAYTLALGVGATSEDLLLAARPASVLTGTVWSDGRPCSKGEVRARRSPRGEWVAAIGQDGVARFTSLTPGHYSIDVYCDQALPHRESLELARGLHEREWRVQTGLLVRGTVVDARGRSVPDAKVAIRPRGELSERQLALCSSDTHGRFACGGLSPGEHDASVADPADAAAQVVPLVLQAGAVPDILLRVRPFGSIRVVIDPAGPSARAARVFARGPTAFPIEARRDEQGYLFERLPLARYEVYVDQPRARGAARVVELEQDGHLLTLELPAPQAEVIAGSVVDENGTPLIDSWVSASPSDPLAQSGLTSEPEVLTDERGAFRLDAVGGGVYDLRAKSALGIGELRGVVAGSSEVVLRITSESAEQWARQ